MADMQSAVASEVNRRLENAVGDLQRKYALGQGGNDASIDGPTGAAYKEAAEEARRKKSANKKPSEDRSGEIEKEKRLEKAIEEDEDLDDDPELNRLREMRLLKLKQEKDERLENISKGHGQYRDITQDEFLPEVTGSMKVICHFYHNDFPRCKIMDHHLSKLAPRHVEAKFIKINAEKAPFFVEKLTIRSIPTVVCFNNGVAEQKIVGFNELSDKMPPGKEDEWPTVMLAKLLSMKGMLNANLIVDDDDVKVRAEQTLDQLRSAYLQAMPDDDIDFDDLDN